LVSDEAAASGIQSLSIQDKQISAFTKGIPNYYGAKGGPFNEPDYYGYNDSEVIPQLTFDEGHYPEKAKLVTVSIQFSSSATENSKVMFLCYGTDAHGNGLKTAFSTGTLFVTPEYSLGGIVAFAACFCGYIIFKKRDSFSNLKKTINTN
jgi:hypothetical protein